MALCHQELVRESLIQSIANKQHANSELTGLIIMPVGFVEMFFSRASRRDHGTSCLSPAGHVSDYVDERTIGSKVGNELWLGWSAVIPMPTTVMAAASVPVSFTSTNALCLAKRFAGTVAHEFRGELVSPFRLEVNRIGQDQPQEIALSGGSSNRISVMRSFVCSAHQL
jgi:hypothetical protein